MAMVTFHSFIDDPLMNAGAVLFMVLFLFLLFIFLIFILSFFTKRRPVAAKMRRQPMAVVIPAYNAASTIVSCLESVLKARYPKGLLDIVVVDDGSTDRTSLIVKEFIRKHPQRKIRLLQQIHQGKVIALNSVIPSLHDPFVITLDADVIVDKDALLRLLGPFQDRDVAATNAIAKIHRPRTILAVFQAIEFAMNDLIRTSFSSVFRNSIWFYGAVACYRKEALLAVGGFNPAALTDDMDLCLTLYRHGYRIVTVKAAVMQTFAVPTLSSLFRQRMRWYFGASQSLVRHRKLLQKKRISWPVLFLFTNHFWWVIFAFLFFPLTIIQVLHWYPDTSQAAAAYLFRWFSLAGPFYVLWKVPEWGINVLNIFGVSSGIITLIFQAAALKTFKVGLSWMTPVCLFFYFPYTILMDAIIVASMFWYGFKKKRYFID